MSDPTQPPPPEGNPYEPPPAGAPTPPQPPAYGSTPPPPPPPPPAFGAPAAPGYGAVAAPQNSAGTVALVTGIISLFCCGFILGVVAIIQGRKGMALADQGLATNRGMAQAGFILGIVGVVLWAGWLIVTIATGSFSFKTG